MKTKRLISFAPSDFKRVQRQAAKMEISVSELIRRIVGSWLDAIKRAKKVR